MQKVQCPILLVEDDPRDVELTLHSLVKSRLANEVVVARDGEEAANLLFGPAERRIRPAVVLLDIKLPKITGLDLLARIRRDPETTDLPVIMLTGSNEEVDLARGRSLGVNAYVVKPLGLKAYEEALLQVAGFLQVIDP